MTIAGRPSIGTYGILVGGDAVKVLVLGGNGMLGSMVTYYLHTQTDYQVEATYRDAPLPEIPVAWHFLDAAHPRSDLWEGVTWVINCLGITKPRLAGDARGIMQAIQVNALFPWLLAQEAETWGFSVIHITTDCVFAGDRAPYDEFSPADAVDVYGKTKSLGEVASPQVFNIRTSIVGPELRRRYFLLSWFLDQPEGATVNGFANHRWNGITTLHFAKLCHALMEHPQIRWPPSRLLHITAAKAVSKAQLLGIFQRHFRTDLHVRNAQATQSLDRRLTTRYPEIAQTLWAGAGLLRAPTVEEMVKELRTFCENSIFREGNIS